MMLKCWERAGAAEKKLFAAISCLLAQRPQLLEFLFDPAELKLSAAPDDLIAAARSLCSADFLMVRVALDLWSGTGMVRLPEVIEADDEVYAAILSAMSRLAA